MKTSFIFDEKEEFQNLLAGVSIDNIDSDDFQGVCLESVPFPLTRTLMCGFEGNANFCTLPSNFSQILALTNPDYNLPSPFKHNSFAYYEGDYIKEQIKRKVGEKLLLENFQVQIPGILKYLWILIVGFLFVLFLIIALSFLVIVSLYAKFQQ
jgi:hypothetical protein